jgi:hypothetical protein
MDHKVVESGLDIPRSTLVSVAALLKTVAGNFREYMSICQILKNISTLMIWLVNWFMLSQPRDWMSEWTLF